MGDTGTLSPTTLALAFSPLLVAMAAPSTHRDRIEPAPRSVPNYKWP